MSDMSENKQYFKTYLSSSYNFVFQDYVNIISEAIFFNNTDQFFKISGTLNFIKKLIPTTFKDFL